MLATLLFATSKGWQALPKPFKEYANQTLISEELLAKIAQGVSLTYLQDTIEKFTTPLSGVWQPTPTTLMKKRLLAFIAQQGWECAFDIISLPSEVQFSVKGSKLTTKAKVGSIKIDTHIDYDIFWQQMAQLDWVNFKMDKQLQKTKITS